MQTTAVNVTNSKQESVPKKIIPIITILLNRLAYSAKVD
jgi:hypothetical protein